MRTLVVKLLVFAAALATACAASAQTAPAPVGARTAAKTTAAAEAELRASQLRQSARALVFATAGEAAKWNDKAALVQTLSGAADLIWDEQPERSRAWLEQAWDVANTIEERSSVTAATHVRNRSERERARFAILDVAQRRDPQLAAKLVEQLASEREPADGGERRGPFDDRNARSEQLLSLAMSAVERNPKLAAALAERSLADGISYRLQQVLLSLRGRDAAAADHLFDAALSRLETRFTHVSEAHVLASYLFTPGRVMAAGEGGTLMLALDEQAANTTTATPADADPKRARRFLNVIQLLLIRTPTMGADSPSTAIEVSVLINSLATAFERYAPDLWIALQQRLSQVAADLPPSTDDPTSSLPESVRAAAATGSDERELNRLYRESLEAAADSETNPVARKLAYVKAALAASEDELARGRRIAAKIDDADLREQVVSFLVYRAALFALNRGRVDEAVALADEARPLARSALLIAAASKMLDRDTAKGGATEGARTRTREFLNTADALLKRAGVSAEATRVRLGLINTLARLDTASAFDMLNEVIESVNKSESENFMDGELPRSIGLDGFSAQLSLPRLRSGYGLRDVFRSLALKDFEAAASVADKLRVPEIRGACLLEVARAVLNSEGGTRR
jgi:hypothetical protein